MIAEILENAIVLVLSLTLFLSVLVACVGMILTIFPVRNRCNPLRTTKIIEMEQALCHSELCARNLKADDEHLLEKLRLKLEYTDSMDDNIAAELRPIDSDAYYGLIRISKELEGEKNAYIHEVIRYIFNVGYGEKVTSTYKREKRRRKAGLNREEMDIDYMARAYIMPCDEIAESLEVYDDSIPKMDELEFIADLEARYGQSRSAVFKRIREVRRLRTRGYC